MAHQVDQCYTKIDRLALNKKTGGATQKITIKQNAFLAAVLLFFAKGKYIYRCLYK